MLTKGSLVHMTNGYVKSMAHVLSDVGRFCEHSECARMDSPGARDRGASQARTHVLFTRMALWRLDFAGRLAHTKLLIICGRIN